MEIVLLSDYPQLGFTGERVEVRPGYARNHLIPTGIAVEVNKRNEKFLKNKFQAIEARKAELKAEAEGLGQKVLEAKLHFKLKSAEAGKSFGSVGAKEIVAELAGNTFHFDKNQITLENPVKKSGEYTFLLKLHSDVVIEVPFTVEVEVSKRKKTAKENDAEVNQQTADSESAEGEVDAAEAEIDE